MLEKRLSLSCLQVDRNSRDTAFRVVNHAGWAFINSLVPQTTLWWKSYFALLGVPSLECKGVCSHLRKCHTTEREDRMRDEARGRREKGKGDSSRLVGCNAHTKPYAIVGNLINSVHSELVTLLLLPKKKCNCFKPQNISNPLL